MKFTTIEAGLDWMNNLHSPIKRQGLDKIRVALDYIDWPHRDLPIIHLTGTNGKGSTVSYLRNLLSSQGLKVMTFTSPHITKFNERFTYDQELISDEDLLTLLNQLAEVNDYMATTEYGILFYFDLYVVMLSLYMAMKQPDVTIIEVGIGGRQDATNLFDGDQAIITTVALDHAAELGDTIESVAYEKAGIIKPGADVIIGRLPEAALAEVRDQVAATDSRAVYYGQDYQAVSVAHLGARGSRFDLQLADGQVLEDLAVGMVGHHQVDNACVALEAFHHWMQSLGQPVDEAAARQALLVTRWPGRLEQLSSQPLIYLDGAHNVAGLTALREAVEDYFGDKRVTILYAGLARKNQELQLPLLLSFPSQSIWLTQFDHQEAMTEEGFNAIDPAVREQGNKQINFVADWQQFLDDYLADAHPDEDLLLVTGSLYFVSQLREYYLAHHQ